MKKRKQFNFRNLQRIAIGILLVGILSISWSSVGAQSSTYVVWTGNAGDGKWETPGNWSTNRVPDASSDVSILKDCKITVSRQVEINSLKMKAGNCSLTGTESSQSVIIRVCENVRIDDGNTICGCDNSMGKDGGNVEICSERGNIENSGKIFGGMGKENTNGGSVGIFATNGHILNSGLIEGHGGGENGNGGSVEIIAGGNLTNHSVIDGGKSGVNGDGGEVRIISGGNVMNSSTIRGGPAESGGDGGSVVIKANGNITNDGEISGGMCKESRLGGSVDIAANGNIFNSGKISEGEVGSETKGLVKEYKGTDLEYGVVLIANKQVTIGKTGKISAQRKVSISAAISVSMKGHQGEAAIDTKKEVYIKVPLSEGTIDLREIRADNIVIRTAGLHMAKVPLIDKGVILTQIIKAEYISPHPDNSYHPSPVLIEKPGECMTCSKVAYCDPPIWGNFMAFPAVEKPSNSRLNNGEESNSIVLCYKNLITGQVTKTDLLVSDSFHAIDVYQTIVAFVNQDSHVLYLDINTGKVKEIGATGHHPSVYGNFITFVSEGRIFCFDLTTQMLIDTHVSGDRPSIWNEKIVFHTNPGPTIQIYDLSTRTVSDTSIIGLNANIYESKIVFETPESLVSECLNDDGDTDDVVIRYYDLKTQKISNTGAAGFYPVIYGDTIAFTVSEKDVGKDLNVDGKILGNVIHYYSLETESVINTRELGTEPDIFEDTITYYVWEHWIGKDLNEDGDLDDSVLRAYTIPAGEMAVQDQDIGSFLIIFFICSFVLIFWRKK
ncbi:MAG: hypothetical protein WBA22_19230 [Candidatus Methanofastidiosia archaeon]